MCLGEVDILMVLFLWTTVFPFQLACLISRSFKSSEILRKLDSWIRCILILDEIINWSYKM